jgi:hypothetical protein
VNHGDRVRETLRAAALSEIIASAKELAAKNEGLDRSPGPQ